VVCCVCVCVLEGLAMHQDDRGSPRGQTVDRLVSLGTYPKYRALTGGLAMNLHPCCLDMAFVGSHLPVSMASKTIACSLVFYPLALNDRALSAQKYLPSHLNGSCIKFAEQGGSVCASRP
jgi:hypothetical protein